MQTTAQGYIFSCVPNPTHLPPFYRLQHAPLRPLILPLLLRRLYISHKRRALAYLNIGTCNVALGNEVRIYNTAPPCLYHNSIVAIAIQNTV